MAAKKAVKVEENTSGETMLRIPKEFVAELDAWVDELNAAGEEPQWTRSAVVRKTLRRALAERRAKGEKP